MKKRDLSFMVCLFFLAGCISLPEAQIKVEHKIPSEWSTAAQGEGKLQPWLTAFNDAKLDELVAEALEANHDYAAAGHRWRQAAEQVRVVGALRYPQLTANASANKNKRNFIGFGALQGGGGQVSSSVSTTYAPSLDLSWELDVWGRINDERLAAVSDAQAAELLYYGASLSLAGQVAENWFTAIAANELFRFAEGTAANYRKQVDTLKSQYQSGVTEALDLKLVITNAATAESEAERLKRERDHAIRSLEILLGRYPNASMELPDTLPIMVDETPVGLPASLLERRPDLLAASLEVDAARLRAGADQKARLPNLAFGISGGTSAAEFKDALNDAYSVWSLAANLAQPIFTAGRLSAAAERAKERWLETLENYRTLVLRAFYEVESALAAEGFIKRQHRSLGEAAEASMAAESIAWERYRSGLSDVVAVLEAQRRAYGAGRSLIEVKRMLLINRVRLYLGLGGDFEETIKREEDHGS